MSRIHRLIYMWLSDAIEEHEKRADKARMATDNSSGSYGLACRRLAQAHDDAAAVYRRAYKEETEPEE